MEEDFIESLKSARSYGLGEFLEIIGELSQQSTKKGALDHGASRQQVFEVMPLALLMDGAPALSQIPRLVKALNR